MFEQIKNYLILFLIISLLGLGTYAFIQLKRAEKFKKQASDRESIMNIKERDWTTKNGKVVHENSVVKLQSDKVIKELFKRDSSTNALLKDLNIKWNKVQSLSKTTVINHYHIDTTIVPTSDSTYKFKWNNTWLSLNGEIDIVKKRITQYYIHKDTITQVIHYKRSKKFLGIISYGKMEFVSNTIVADTNSKIINQATFIKDK